MPWIISIVSLLLLTGEAFVVTLIIIIGLNGYPSLADLIPPLYIGLSTLFILTVSGLNGWGAKQLSATGRLPLWEAGMLLMVAALVATPIFLVFITIVLVGTLGTG